MSQDSATIATLLTPARRGAVASIALAGPAADDLVASHFQPAGRRPAVWQPGRIVFGRWISSGEEIVVCRLAATRYELHCHGGTQAAQSILDALATDGCQVTSWQDSGAQVTPSRVQHEAAAALAAATTLRTASILLDQHQGAWQREAGILGGLLQQGDWLALRGRVEEMLSYWPLGRHLIAPFKVVLCGRPNAGKSSLNNALLGYERAIVHDQPGTTRDIVAGATAIDGWPVELSDVAGLRLAINSLEAAGVEKARQELALADLVLLVIDGARCPDAGAEAWLQQERHELIEEARLTSAAASLLVVNKSDLLPTLALPESSGMLVSALTGAGLQPLLAAMAERLVPRVPPPGAAVPFNERQHCLLARLLAAIEQRRIEVCYEIAGEMTV